MILHLRHHIYDKNDKDEFPSYFVGDAFYTQPFPLQFLFYIYYVQVSLVKHKKADKDQDTSNRFS